MPTAFWVSQRWIGWLRSSSSPSNTGWGIRPVLLAIRWKARPS
jgi:hypothetical protein